MSATFRVVGELMGQRVDPQRGHVLGEIVRVSAEQRPQGPAENAFLLVEPIGDTRRGRYISWINYFDIEYASRYELRAWRLIEPAQSYDQEILWAPFGWTDRATVPTIGDSILRRQA